MIGRILSFPYILRTVSAMLDWFELSCIFVLIQFGVNMKMITVILSSNQITTQIER